MLPAFTETLKERKLKFKLIFYFCTKFKKHKTSIKFLKIKTFLGHHKKFEFVAKMQQIVNKN